MSKNNTIARIKQRKELKAKIVKGWYFLMKPLAKCIDKYDKYKGKRHSAKVDKITDDKAVEIYIKKLTKSIVNYCEDFIIADRVSCDYNWSATIIEKMKNQRESKVLKSWAYRQKDDKETNKKLTDLLVEKLKEYPEIDCEYYHNDSDKWNSRGYETSLVISLKDK